MKLVEILARELHEWPDGAAVAVQDLDRQVCFNLASNGIVFRSAEWGDLLARGLWCHSARMASLATDYATAIVTREMWEAERAKLKRAVEWDGDGLPTIGSLCEVEIYEQEWFKCTVVGHYEGRAAIVLANKETAHIANPDQLRPIRTPEQIAAQERERALDEIYRILRTVDRPGNKADMAEALYDAGYRKQEKGQ